MLIDAFAEFWDWLVEWFDFLPDYMQVTFGFVVPLFVFGASTCLTWTRLRQISEALIVGLVVSVFLIGVVGFVEH